MTVPVFKASQPAWSAGATTTTRRLLVRSRAASSGKVTLTMKFPRPLQPASNNKPITTAPDHLLSDMLEW
jgi:hypothetical protein